MAQRIRRETTNLEIAGSNPAGDDHLLHIYIFVSYKKKKNNRDGIWTRNPWIRSPVRYPIAPRGQQYIILLLL